MFNEKKTATMKNSISCIQWLNWAYKIWTWIIINSDARKVIFQFFTFFHSHTHTHTYAYMYANFALCRFSFENEWCFDFKCELPIVGTHTHLNYDTFYMKKKFQEKNTQVNAVIRFFSVSHEICWIKNKLNFIYAFESSSRFRITHTNQVEKNGTPPISLLLSPLVSHDECVLLE